MHSDDDFTTEEGGRREWTTLVLPILVLLVVVGIVCVLVLTGAVSADEDREIPGEGPTTTPTIQITP